VLTKKEVKVEEDEEIENEEEDKKNGKRYFKCLMITMNDDVIVTGRYSGKKPKQAASKACTKIFEDITKEHHEIPDYIIFGMHECTRWHEKKKEIFLYR